MKGKNIVKRYSVIFVMLVLLLLSYSGWFEKGALGVQLTILSTAAIWNYGFADGETPSKKRSALTAALVALSAVMMFGFNWVNPFSNPKRITDIADMPVSAIEQVYGMFELEDGVVIGGALDDQASRQAAILIGSLDVKRSRGSRSDFSVSRISFVATIDGHRKTWDIHIDKNGLLEYDGKYYDVVDGRYSGDYLMEFFEGSWTDGPLSLFFPSLSNVEEITACDSQTGNGYTLEGDRAAGLAATLSGLEISLDYGLELDPSILRYRIEFEGGVISLAKNYMVIKPQGKEAVSCHPHGSYDMQALAALFEG